MIPSHYDCPECGKPLHMEWDQEDICVLWCGYGECANFSACNDGGEGPTERAAFDKLMAAWIIEPKGEE